MAQKTENHFEYSRRNDPFLDFCLWDYAPPAPGEGKFRSINLLYHSFEIAGVAHGMIDLCTSLRNNIGEWRTVWGVKNIEGRLSWEFYFYDYNRLARNVSISRVIDIFRRFTNCTLNINEDCLYFMFSLDVDNDIVTGKKDINEINVYLGDISEHVSAGICYLLDKGGLQMNNLYHFFDANTSMRHIADKIVSSLHLTLSSFDINQVLIPDFVNCKTIVVANKKLNDGIYFSRINVGQLIVFLTMMEYPAELVEFVKKSQDKLDHLLYDIGIDYRMEQGKVRYLKSGYYGVF